MFDLILEKIKVVVFKEMSSVESILQSYANGASFLCKENEDDSNPVYVACWVLAAKVWTGETKEWNFSKQFPWK